MIHTGSQFRDVAHDSLGPVHARKMATEIHCPRCGAGFQLNDLMRTQLENEVRESVRTEVDARLRTKDDELAAIRKSLASAAAAEADLLKKQRELETAKQAVERDIERRIADETQRIRESEAKAAQERYQREAEDRVRASETELTELRGKLAASATAHASLLKKEREVAERERQVDVALEHRLAEESVKIREREAKAAEERYSRVADERLRASDAELADARARLAEAAANEAGLLKKRREVEERERQLAADVERRVAEESARIREVEGKAAAEHHARAAAAQIRQKEEELEDARTKLADAATHQAAILKKERELEERAGQMDLDVERRVSEEAKRIREDATKLAEERAAMETERQRLRDEEHRLQMEAMKKNIAELQRRAQQGSQQLQGEAQEVLLRDLLVEAFADDDIEDVAKGVLGADALQRVRGARGGDCGTIVWESKRTKAWSDDWLAKARDDQRVVGAACAIIVTQAMPRDIQHFGVRENVWVCAWPFAVALGAAIRAGLVEVALARRSAEGRGEKMQMLYEYLTGTEFRNRVGGFVEAFKEMQDELESEKRAMLTRWKRRERLMQRARDNICAFYGDLQGIAGRQIEDLPPLSLDLRSLPLAEPEELDGPNDQELKELLYGLVPDDGSNAGNGSLVERFMEQALAGLGVLVTAADYERCKAALLAEGRVRRGKGKGGSVCRG